MILNPDDIRQVRPIAENLHDTARLMPYIHEAENLRLIDAIGADLYRWLDSINRHSEDPVPPFHGIEVERSDIKALFEGGYYQGCGCVEIEHNPGLIEAIAYIAYARFLGNNQINATAFGVVTKMGEFSSSTADASVVRAQNEARMIGEAYLKKAIAHLGALGLLDCCKPVYKQSPRRAYVIGNRKKA